MVDRAPTESPGKQDLIDIADQPVEIVRVADVAVAAGGGIGDPAAVSPDQIRAHDHAAVLVLEALGGVDAAHLPEPGVIVAHKMAGGTPFRTLAPLKRTEVAGYSTLPDLRTRPPASPASSFSLVVL